MADSRACEQCGTEFVSCREHARFCCIRCRATWNREHVGDPLAEASALLWSITAMSEATARLPRPGAWDQNRAFAAIAEAVWWVTLVDATLVRHYPGAYDTVIAGQPPGERQRTEGVLAGLRFVRNRLGVQASLAEFIRPAPPGPSPGPGPGRITGWTWKPVARPALASLPRRAQAWEKRRYQAYQAQLAGRTIGEVLQSAVTFLTLAANAGTIADLASANAHGQTRQWV